MRFAFLAAWAAIGAAVAAPARAQAPENPRTLPIPLPPNAVVLAEVEGREGDLLGMVKSFIAGLSADAAAAPPAPPTGPGFDALSYARFALTGGQLAALLKDIHHLHILMFTSAPNPTPNGPAASTDLLPFYEQAFAAQGGRRLLWVNVEPRVLMTGFDNPRGFAAVAQDPRGAVLVVRADGYPDLTALAGLVKYFLIVDTSRQPPPPTVRTSPAPPGVPRSVPAPRPPRGRP